MEDMKMKIIEVKTCDDALDMVFKEKLSDKYAIKIVDNIYESDKDFKGIIFHVKGE